MAQKPPNRRAFVDFDHSIARAASEGGALMRYARHRSAGGACSQRAGGRGYQDLGRVETGPVG